VNEAENVAVGLSHEVFYPFLKLSLSKRHATTTTAPTTAPAPAGGECAKPSRLIGDGTHARAESAGSTRRLVNLAR
jgi:hypothetical protein